MGQYFLASVGNAEAFRKVKGVLQPFFSAKTLTESSIAVSVSSEEVRGGSGAKLLGQFFHTSKFDLTMTDAIFKLEYIAAQVGGNIIAEGDVMVDVSKEATGGKVTLDETPVEILPGSGAIVWYNLPGSVDYKMTTAVNKVVTVDGIKDGTAVCLHYCANKKAARKLIVSADFVPAEFVVFLTAKLFAGDASAPETGKPVGTITIKIPRFQLDGNFDLSMAMSSAATVSLKGTALAYGADCEGSRYAEITEFIYGAEPLEGYKLVADGAANTVGTAPVIYAVKIGALPVLIPNEDITFTPALTDGNIPTGTAEITMKLKDNAAVTGSFMPQQA